MERPFDGQFPHEESDDAYAAYLEDRVQKSMQNNLAMANAMTRKEQGLGLITGATSEFATN